MWREVGIYVKNLGAALIMGSALNTISTVDLCSYYVNRIIVACSSSPRINRSYAADAISLLQTPPVRRHTGGLKGLSSAHRQPDFVPQSIIKTKSTEVKRVNVSVSVTDGGRAGITWPAMPGQ